MEAKVRQLEDQLEREDVHLSLAQLKTYERNLQSYYKEYQRVFKELLDAIPNKRFDELEEGNIHFYELHTETGILVKTMLIERETTGIRNQHVSGAPASIFVATEVPRQCTPSKPKKKMMPRLGPVQSVKKLRVVDRAVELLMSGSNEMKFGGQSATVINNSTDQPKNGQQAKATASSLEGSDGQKATVVRSMAAQFGNQQATVPNWKLEAPPWCPPSAASNALCSSNGYHRMSTEMCQEDHQEDPVLFCPNKCI